ncbi:hypothetical protein VN97_g5467 [Penicillium thymicola]|uniref:Uncharacterized protein n=1 Tax=Penicillium thymicola TaxID=293382 RepID=A0AAI9X8J5_PENTH|nr:hypothetical protein VN97_g5467 [Penicillium thymicola]
MLSCYSCKLINARFDHGCCGLYPSWWNLCCFGVASSGGFIHFPFVCLLCLKMMFVLPSELSSWSNQPIPVWGSRQHWMSVNLTTAGTWLSIIDLQVNFLAIAIMHFSHR